MDRRTFLKQAAAGSVAAASAAAAGAAPAGSEIGRQVLDASLTGLSGKPRERGKRYGQEFRAPIHAFLEREIYGSFTGAYSRDAMLRYAGECAAAIRKYSPPIHEELEGMAEGSGLRLEDLVLITLHE